MKSYCTQLSQRQNIDKNDLAKTQWFKTKIEELLDIDYAKYLETTSKSKAEQPDVDTLADEVNINWWNKNKHRFILC